MTYIDIVISKRYPSANQGGRTLPADIRNIRTILYFYSFIHACLL